MDQHPHLIPDLAALRALIGEPRPEALLKLTDHVNATLARFIAASSLVLVATADPEGGLDVSPRGDPAGFVRVLDEHTLLLPERPGSRIADTLTNLLKDPRIGLLFVTAGVGGTLRVNGRAMLTDDAELLAPCAVHGRPPTLGILICVEEVFTQRPKAFERAGLWDPETFVDPASLPSGGEVLRSLHLGVDADAEGFDAERAARDEREPGSP
ncbi:MAG TPA: MSMEG_1061 family FMN-dependent PPOX-type flavoprotein [Solirubrobacteraceae bacterium]|nr:MSMEG_1061 family FMN-dependent PPOX-type flavoprotein [Solirubrobacteraceae bacterium]